jgi:hypothetical protein
MIAINSAAASPYVISLMPSEVCVAELIRIDPAG